MRPVIIVENVCKVYQHKDTTNLFLNFFFKRKAVRSSRTALDKVSFILNEGDILGVIGNNGAGKSTLLKLLSRVTSPSSGKIVMEGKVSSLLEIGTGFHPDLTGTENVFVNGTLLGMTKQEIDERLPEIIKFSGIGDFMHLPMRNYSSGMVVRLAFSIAAHLESDILLLDEVFAVGDAEFKKKSIDKIEELFEKGKTIIYVSHDLDSIKKLCTKCLYLSNGKVIAIGDVDSVLNSYRIGEDDNLPSKLVFNGKDHSSFIRSLSFVTNNQTAVFSSTDAIVLEVVFFFSEKDANVELNISFFMGGQKILMLFGSDLSKDSPFQKGENRLLIELPKGLFNIGLYHVNLVLHNDRGLNMDVKKEAIFFKVNSNHKKFDRHLVKQPGIINIDDLIS